MFYELYIDEIMLIWICRNEKLGSFICFSSNKPNLLKLLFNNYVDTIALTFKVHNLSIFSRHDSTFT